MICILQGRSSFQFARSFSVSLSLPLIALRVTRPVSRCMTNNLRLNNSNSYNSIVVAVAFLLICPKSISSSLATFAHIGL